MTGQGVKVAVFDTGISSHTDLQIKGGVSFVEGSNFNVDENGHGTHVAGIIGSLINNEGIVGVAPSVELYSVKVLDSAGNGSYSSIIKGIEWAIDNNINIINMSLGGFEYSAALEEAINLAYDNNILIVASAGNTGEQMTYPAKYEKVISVGAVDGNNNKAVFSSVGEELDVVAPGVNIKSTFTNGSYAVKSGTSMAAPHATGVLALIWGKNLAVDNEVIQGLLNYSALGLGDNFSYGNGLVDASNALDMYDEYVHPKKEKKKTKTKKYVSDNKKKIDEQNESGDSRVTVNGVTEAYYLESPHPYSNNYSNTWTISKAGATNIRVHFTRIDTEANYDYVRTSAGDSWTGSYNDVWSSWSGSSSINVTLSSDGSITKDGFYIDKIEFVAPTSTGGSTIQSYTLESPHPYSNNYSNTWTISKAGATNIRVHFTRIDTEANYDYVRTSAGDSWTGSYNDVWSSWSGSSSINVTLSSDGSITKDGFYIDKIEFVAPTSTGAGTIQSYTLESPHPYSNNYSNTWTISKAGATNIRVHFTRIDTEANYDYVRTSAGDSWTGSYNDVWSSWSGSSSINVTLSSDGSITKDGFYIDKIEFIAPSSGGTSSELYTLESPHPYSNNYSNTWTISKAGATNIRVHFTRIDTEANYDYVRTSAGDSWTGSYNDVWSSWSGSSSINITLTTDGSITRDGFYIDKIEYITSSTSSLEDYEIAVDPYWPDEEDTFVSNPPRTGYLSGHINPPSSLTVYDDAIFEDPDLVQYMVNTPQELEYDDTDNMSSYPQISYEDTAPEPADTAAVSTEFVPAWLIPAAVPIIVRIGTKLYVKQFLKNNTKKILIRNAHLAGKTHPKTGVRFSSQGFPIFPYKYQLNLPQSLWKSSNSTQFRYANSKLLEKINSDSTFRSKFTSEQLADIRNGKTPRGYVWHHHEKTGRLQLVDKNLHDKTGHTGGKAIWGSL
ncbi:S8 family serine peptidase [Geobacillus stearothermophilus]|nr:S8 family serine peptidase [Geobacillus stearothermophilus]